MEKRIILGEYKLDFENSVVATEIGQQLWDRDKILDFSEIDSIPDSFLKILLSTAFEKRDYSSAIQFVDIESMGTNLQREFLRIYKSIGKSEVN